MRWTILSVAMIGLLVSSGCGKKPAPAGNQQATVTLRDGTTFTGTVTSNSTSEITLIGANGETRTYPMSQVDSVQYGQPQQTAATNPPPAAAPAIPQPAAPASPPPVQQSPAPAPAHSREPAAPPPPLTVVSTVPAGTVLRVRTNETIDSATASPGQAFSGVISEPVVDTDGRVAIPRGADATLVVHNVAAQGRIEGRSELALDMDAVTIGGRRYALETGNVVQQGSQGLGKNKRTGVFVGGGTVLGTLLGAVAGGGKGAAIGAISGAAAGTATQAITRGKGVRVPAETLLTFRLEAPVRIRAMR